MKMFAVLAGLFCVVPCVPAQAPLAIRTHGGSTWDVERGRVRTEHVVHTGAGRGVTGEYVIASEVLDAGVKTIKPGEHATFAVVFTAREAQAPKLNVQVDAEENARRERVDSFLSKLQLETPDPV